MAFLYFETKTDLFDDRPKDFLHVAPERSMEKALKRRLRSGYVTADLHNPLAMVKMDITDIRYPDESFDVVYCSHVLEHVDDDRKAMRELHRVLRSNGWAVLLVPITADVTFEDPSVTDPARRLELFGQADHVRRYGPDYVERLRDAGFDVQVVTATDMFSAGEVERLGIENAGEIYYCTKRSV